MCNLPTFNTEKLYIHTNMYDVSVLKPRFWTLLRNSCTDYEVMLNAIYYKTLYAIFCYKDGIVRFTYEAKESIFDDRTYSTELRMNHFQERLNRIIKRYQKENTS